MALFFEISPVVARYQGTVRRGIRRALGQLPGDLVGAYKDSLTEPTGTALSFAHWILHNQVLFAGYFQAMLILDSRSVHRQGIEILPWDHGLYDSQQTLPAGLRSIVHSERISGRNLHFFGVVPSDLEAPARVILDAELLPFARTYFLHAPGLHDERTVDLVQSLEADLRRLCLPHLENAVPVTFTHFRFQDMAIYFEMSGEHRSLEILAEIRAIVEQRLKSADELIMLAPGSLVVISPGARAVQMRERFNSVYFQTRSLLLDFTMEVHTLERPPIRFAELWRALGV